MMQVKIEKKYGVDVFVSAEAEAARKSSCLCIRTENGEMKMCAHLKANQAARERLKQFITEDGSTPDSEIDSMVQKCLVDRALEEFSLLYKWGEPFAKDGVCRIALINYALRVMGNIGQATSRCPHFKDEETPQQESAKFPEQGETAEHGPCC